MTETYCDIIPQAAGWAFVFEGRQSAVYPTYRMAVEAARYCSEKLASKSGKLVLRQQDLRGRMHEVQGRSDIWSPLGRGSSMSAHAGTGGQA